MAEHARLLTEHHAGDHGIRDFRKHAGWYLTGYPVGPEIRRQLGLDGRHDELSGDLGDRAAQPLVGDPGTPSGGLYFPTERERAQAALTLATTKAERSRANLDTLRQQRNAYRSGDKVDLQELIRMDNAIINETANLARYEEMEEKAGLKLAEAQKDTARLMYLEREWASSGDCPVMECDGKFFAPSSKVRAGGDLRAAIDAARGKV